MGAVRIGISGFLYPNWRGTFYPASLPRDEELAYAADQFDSIEINGSFYSLLTPASYASFRERTPDDFVFSVKGSRFITHMKKLRGAKTALANFFASGVLALEEKLGPILWQLPPNLGFDRDRLVAFFEALPRDTEEASRLARRHDSRLKARARFSYEENRPIRHAIEVRHPSFADPSFFAMLEEHDVAFCVADTAGRFPELEAATTDFVYVRLHGDVELYKSGYSARALDAWAAKVKAWRRAHDVFVYFDNDARVHAPFDAMALRQRVKVSPRPRRRAARGSRSSHRSLPLR
ncbi:MAG: DUF72 domain-containing protein [Polyangiales bacterium]